MKVNKRNEVSALAPKLHLERNKERVFFQQISSLSLARIGALETTKNLPNLHFDERNFCVFWGEFWGTFVFILYHCVVLKTT